MAPPRVGTDVPVDRLGASAFRGPRLGRPGTWTIAFLADWCPYCRAFAPHFAALDGSISRFAIADVTDEESPLWDQFSIEVVPTVIIFRDGRAAERFDGQPGAGLGPDDLDRIRRAASSTPSAVR